MQQLIKLEEETKTKKDKSNSLAHAKSKDSNIEEAMTRDITSDGVVSGKSIQADTTADLESSQPIHGEHEKVRMDRDGKYIDDYSEEYYNTQHEIKDTLDGTDFHRRRAYHPWHSDQYYDNLHGDLLSHRHLNEEQWLLKEKKEKENFELLSKKEIELEKAEKDVTQAQESLTLEKKRIDEEINKKIEETKLLNKQFEKKAADRAEADRKAAEDRERLEIAEHQADKKRRTEQLKETSEIEQKAYQLHVKELELHKQKSLVEDALAEVSDEIQRVTH